MGSKVEWSDPRGEPPVYTSAEPARPGLNDLQYGHDEGSAHEPEHQRTAYVEALKVERAGYLRYGRTERAAAVAAVLGALGVEVEQQQTAPKVKRPPRRT